MSFLKRLVGRDEESIAAQRRFDASLSHAAAHERRLNDAGVAIEAIIRDVDRQKEAIAMSPSTSGRRALPSLPPFPLSNTEEEHG